MKLVDMKLPKKSKKELEKEMTASDPYREEYPWGMQLSFDQEQIDKLDALQGVAADTKVKIHGEGYIRSVIVGDHADKKRKHQNVEIQLTKVGVERAGKPAEEMSNEEYRKSRRK